MTLLKPNDVFKITPTEIYAKYNCSVTINEEEYDDKSFIETSDKIQLPGIFDFFIEDQKEYCKIVINYPVNLNKTIRTEKNNHDYTIYYEPNDLVIDQQYHSSDTDLSMWTKLIQGRIKFVNDPKTLINMMTDTIKGIDIVYLEIMVSNMFRRADNETELCRLSGDYEDSVIEGVAKQPFIDSWKSALAFQHIEKAINNGLIKGQPLKNNPIENVLSEEFDKL